MYMFGLHPFGLALALAIGAETVHTVPVKPRSSVHTERYIRESHPQKFGVGSESAARDLSLSGSMNSKIGRRAPPSGGYYREETVMRCYTVSQVRAIWDGMSQRPVRDAMNWPALDAAFGREANDRLILETQERARQCICSHILVQGAYSQALRLREVPTSQDCQTERDARKYEKVYGCYCYRLISQEGAEEEAISANEYSNLEGSLLLGGMPEGFGEYANMRTEIQEGDVRHMAGARTRNFGAVSVGYPMDAQKMPWRKEPYWFQDSEKYSGPTDRNWINNLGGGVGSGY